MSKQATPGPWEVHFSDDGRVWIQEADPSRGHVIVADIPGDMETIEQQEMANASLIAAAPDLAAALEALTEWATDPLLALVAAQVAGLPGPDALIAAADRALAQVRGEER